jgi:hypothetical protein
MAWVNADPARKAKYGEMQADLSQGYAERAKFEKASTYMQEGAFGSEAVTMGFRLYGLMMQLENDPKDAARHAMADGRKPRHAISGRTTTRPRTRTSPRPCSHDPQDVDPAQQPDMMDHGHEKVQGRLQQMGRGCSPPACLRTAPV